MGTEDWVLKGTKLITNTKRQRLKIQSRDWIFKNTILRKEEGEKRKSKHNKTRKQNNNNKKTKPQELLKNTTNNHTKTIYGVCFKKQSFFLRIIVGYRNKDQRRNRGLKNFKKLGKKKRKRKEEKTTPQQHQQKTNKQQQKKETKEKRKKKKE